MKKISGFTILNGAFYEDAKMAEYAEAKYVLQMEMKGSLYEPQIPEVIKVIQEYPLLINRFVKAFLDLSTGELNESGSEQNEIKEKDKAGVDK